MYDKKSGKYLLNLKDLANRNPANLKKLSCTLPF